MSQADEGGKRGKKRKQRQAKPLLEQLPAVAAPAAAAAAGGQQQSPASSQQQQQPHQQAASLGTGNSKFARALGSTDYRTRQQGLQALSRWLLHRPAVSELDMMKLWKGIFFCFWHSDKEPVQAELAELLAGLIPQMQHDGMAALYWAAMLATLRAEWLQLDRHRINKFLMLVRKFVAALLQRLAARNWDALHIRSFTGSGLPMGQSLMPLTHTKCLGLTYHLADVWLPELRKAAAAAAAAGQGGASSGSGSGSSSGLPDHDALVALLAPFAGVLQHSPEAPQVARVREAVFDVLLEDLRAGAAAATADGGGSGSGSGTDSEGEGEGEGTADSSSWAYCSCLDAGAYAEHLFALGAAPGVKARNREALYGVSGQLERLPAKRRRLSGAQPAGAAAAAAAAAAGGGGDEEGGADGAGGANASRRHKQHKQHTQPSPGSCAPAADAPQNGGSSKRQHKRKHAEAAAGEGEGEGAGAGAGVQQQQAAGAAAAAGTPHDSSRKAGKRGAAAAPHQQQEQQQAAVAPKPATPASNGAHKQQQQQQQQSGKHHSHKQQQQQQQQLVSPPAGGKRGVKIALDRNLYHAHGAPPPAADVRTPPSAQPKGSALKATSKFERGRGAAGGAKADGGGAAHARVTPASVPRVRAASFF